MNPKYEYLCIELHLNSCSNPSDYLTWYLNNKASVGWIVQTLQFINTDLVRIVFVKLDLPVITTTPVDTFSNLTIGEPQKIEIDPDSQRTRGFEFL